MIDPTTNMLAGPPTSQSPGGAMTLEMAIRDWHQRLDKQAAEIERLRELLRGLDDGGHWYSQQTMDAVRREKDELRAERDAWRKLVVEHNARMIRDDVESYLIDIPPELEQP